MSASDTALSAAEEVAIVHTEWHLLEEHLSSHAFKYACPITSLTQWANSTNKTFKPFDSHSQ